MTPEPRLERRLRAALRRPEGSPWPDEHGAFDQFLRRRARRGRVLAARGALAVVVAVALAAGIPRLLPSRPARWAAFVSPPLARGTRMTRVLALDASGRPVAESERDQYLSHPVCHIFR